MTDWYDEVRPRQGTPNLPPPKPPPAPPPGPPPNQPPNLPPNQPPNQAPNLHNPANPGGPPINVEDYRVPEESTSYVMAWIALTPGLLLAIAIFVVLSSNGASGLMAAVLFFGLPILVFLLYGRFREAELIGNSVEVTDRNFPLVQSRVQAMKQRLSAENLRVRVFVISDGDYNAKMERFGSRRILVLHGKLLERMPEAGASAELDYIIGRFIGAFKLRHLRFGELLFLMQFRQLPVLNLLMKPWYRATVLTGDRVGLMASGNVEHAMAAMAKLAVSPEGLDGYSIAGHVEQAKVARQSLFHTLYRWLSDFPHLSDRVLRLAQFAKANPQLTINPQPTGPMADLGEAVRVA